MIHNRNHFLGAGSALAASLCWGGMAVAAQALFERGTVSPMELTAVRLLFAGLLFLVLFAPSAVRLLREVRNVRDVVIAGLLAFAGQFCFMQAISHTGAGPSAIILTTVPFWVATWQAVVKRQLPAAGESVCFVLAAFGVCLIVTRGNFATLDFDLTGTLWALGCAVASAAYSIQPRALLQRAPTTAVMAWSMLAGGIVAACIAPPWNMDFALPASDWMLLAVVTVLGTVMAVWFYMSAIRLIPPVLLGIIGISEPLSAYVFSILFLGTVVTTAEGFGAALVLVAVLAVTTGVAGHRR